MFYAGFAKVDISPLNSVPLGGYFSFKPRMSTEIRDSLYVRANAFMEGDLTVVLIVYDLLMITEEMVTQLERRLLGTNAKIIISATHSHSATGGYWDSFAPRLALGKFVPGTLEYLCSQGAVAAKLAIDDLSACRWAVMTAKLPELAINRRDKQGALDNELYALWFNRTKAEKGNAILTGFPGHPVIVAERDFLKISADFPGEVVKKLECDFEYACFINGALGGVDVLFPDTEITADENLELQAEPIANAASKIKKSGLRTKAGLRFAKREMKLKHSADVEIAFKDQKLLSVLSKPLNKLISFVFDKGKINHWRMQAFAIGDTILIGTPADTGVSLVLDIKQYAAKKGFAKAFVISQCDGYLGYIHREKDYQKAPEKDTMEMAIYENVMGIFGHRMGEKVFDVAKELIDELANP